MKKRISRLAFILVCFVLLPLGATVLSLSALNDPYAAFSQGGLAWLKWFATEQKVPALIVFFVLFETAIYSLRYSLPFAAEVGVAGRPGLPKRMRKEYEAAGQLLDDVNRILAKNATTIDKALSQEKRERVDAAMQGLADAMDAPTFDQEAFLQAFDRANELSATHLAQWQRGEVREYAESIFIAVGVALLLRAFVVEAFKIPSGSMLPTLQISDHIFVNKLSYGPTLPFSKTRVLSDLPPERGDVVVFEYPDDNPQNARQNFIKRAIALPGDVLETRGGHPIINGWEVPSCRVGSYTFQESTGYPTTGELFLEFLGEHAYLTLYENYRAERADDREGPYLVADDEFWVLGDNRNSSSDSRRWRNGKGAGVPYENVKGRALFVWLSFNQTGQDILGVTWDRLFTNVMGKPRLPKEAPAELTKGIERCLRERPHQTRPPEPKAARLVAEGEVPSSPGTPSEGAPTAREDEH